MRHAAVAGVLLALGLAWWLWGVGASEAPHEAAVALPTVVVRPAVVAGAPVAAEAVEAESPSPEVEAFQDSLRQVQEHCGFGAAGKCVGDRCGAVVEMPDLDRIQGWAQIVAQQPMFVAATLGRDLGMPVGWNPCVQAMEGFPEVVSVQLDAERELWCVGDVGLCDEQAGDVGFSEPGARRLAF